MISGVFFFKQKTAYEIRPRDWSSDVCSSDLKTTPKYDLRKLMPKYKHTGVYDFESSSDEKDDSEDEYVPSSGTEDEETSIDMADEEGSSRNICDLSLPLPESEEPDQTTISVQIAQTKNTKTTRIYDKKQYCIFCGKSFSKITKHWACCHDKEPEVMEISVEKNRKRKLSLITLLRNKGNHIHNCGVIKEGKGDLVVTYRPNSSKCSNDYRPCIDCLGYYSTKELYRHRCKIGATKSRGRVANKALMLLPAPDSVRPEVLTILNGMLDGAVKDAIRRDNLLLKLASKLFLRHGHEKKDLVRARLREMGRLVVEIQKINGMKNASLADCIKPQLFRTVIDAVRSV